MAASTTKQAGESQFHAAIRFPKPCFPYRAILSAKADVLIAVEGNDLVLKLIAVGAVRASTDDDTGRWHIAADLPIRPAAAQPYHFDGFKALLGEDVLASGSVEDDGGRVASFALLWRADAREVAGVAEGVEARVLLSDEERFLQAANLRRARRKGGG